MFISARKKSYNENEEQSIFRYPLVSVDFQRKRFMSDLMDQTFTYIALIVITALFGLALFKARQPKELGKSWHIPWNGIIFLCLLLILLLIRHILSLNGIELPER